MSSRSALSAEIFSPNQTSGALEMVCGSASTRGQTHSRMMLLIHFGLFQQDHGRVVGYDNAHGAMSFTSWARPEVKSLRQRVMHCPCASAKVLALGLCATCYSLKRQDQEYFGGFERRSWSVMGTVAGPVTPPGETSGRSSCIIECPHGEVKSASSH